MSDLLTRTEYQAIADTLVFPRAAFIDGKFRAGRGDSLFQRRDKFITTKVYQGLSARCCLVPPRSPGPKLVVAFFHVLSRPRVERAL